MRLPDLPIRDVLGELKERLGRGNSAVLAAPPGSGKTTVVPLALLKEEWLGDGAVLILEPRRLAARAAAARMADLLGESVGETVGYRIRFDTQVGKRTRIEVLTEGILARRLQSDPELKGVGLLVFDEFHERSLQSDLALALSLDAQGALRRDLRILVMSATLDTEAVSDALGGAPVVEGGGRLHPVEKRYLERPAKGRTAAVAVRGIRRALDESPGDILVFLPGAGEIKSAASALEEDASSDLLLFPLYGNLPRGEQDRAILPDPQGRRKIVLATNIAETSLTIEGIGVVVDSGWRRTPRFDPNSGLTRLETVRISRASARQRAGRAGRLGPGVCYRLWTRGEQHSLLPFDPPEILEADLAPLALELALWGVSDPSELRFIDPPPEGAFAQARELLRSLGALGARGRATRKARRMARLPVHPRLGSMLMTAKDEGCGPLACDLAALVSERDPLRTGSGPAPCDVEPRLRLLRDLRRQGAAAVRRAEGRVAAAKAVERASRQLSRRIGAKPARASKGHSGELPGELLSCAYPDRIAQLRRGSRVRYRMCNGRGVTLPEGDLLAGESYLVAASLDAGRSEGRLFLGAPLTESALRRRHGDRIEIVSQVRWNDRNEAVEGVEEERLGELTLSSRPRKNADPEAVRAAMLEGIREMGLDCLPWTRTARDWQKRVLSLRQWRPQEDWPDVSDEGLLARLDRWLGPFLQGAAGRKDLDKIDLMAALKARLDWKGQRLLDELAPTHLKVPSGSRPRLRYDPPGPPVLAVKLQELFGLAETPAVCGGEVPVLLHLLSPAQRPVQVTQDLKGFWNRTYPEVKKELAGRYPKHPWPEDPWSATPTRKTKR